MKKVFLFLVCFSSFAFSDSRFKGEIEDENNESTFVEILEVLKQIKIQNEQLVKISRMIHEIALTYSYILDEPLHEAISD